MKSNLAYLSSKGNKIIKVWLRFACGFERSQLSVMVVHKDWELARRLGHKGLPSRIIFMQSTYAAQLLLRVRAVKQEESQINLKVVSQLNELDPYFRVGRDEPLKQLMIRWSVRANVFFLKCKFVRAYAGDYRAIRFLFDGMRVNEDKTPNDMGLEDGDCLDAFMYQVAR
ncbi:ubiquitin-related domain-containing protein [Tanacetum coccineum]